VRSWFAAALLAGLLGVPEAARAAEEIRVGVLLSLSGELAVHGQPERQSIELFAARINQAGGILGRKLHLIVADDGSDPASTAKLMRRLAGPERADLVIGGTGTAASLAAAKVAEAEKLPLLALGSGEAIVEPVRRWVFKVPPGERLAVDTALADMARHGLNRLALLSEDDDAGRASRCLAQERAKAAGLELVADLTYVPERLDGPFLLSELRAAPTRPQAVLILGAGAGPAKATRALKEAGSAPPVYEGAGAASAEFLATVGKAADGVRLPAPALAVAEHLPPTDPQKSVTELVRQAFEESTGHEPGLAAGLGYDALMMAVEAVRRAGTLEKSHIRDEIEKTRRFVGTAGIYTMSPSDHDGLGADALRMVEVKGGDFVPVAD
jgi:branched-chain amino acid transport system substrate-binding protein